MTKGRSIQSEAIFSLNLLTSWSTTQVKQTENSVKQTISRESERKDQRKNPIKQMKKKKLSRYRFGKQKKK